MAEQHDFILVSVGEVLQYLAWAHIVSVAVAPVVTGAEPGATDRLVARIATADGQNIEVYDDDARRLDAEYVPGRADAPDNTMQGSNYRGVPR